MEILNPIGSQQQAKRPMGKEDFLKLFIAQVKHQDPLNPLDSFEFTAQLAQFTQIEQLMNLNDAVKDLYWLQGNAVILQAANFIGKEVVSTESSIVLKDGEATPVHWRLEAEARELRLLIYDEGYRLVRIISLGRQGPGEGETVWDGRDDRKEPLPDGIYRFRLEAEDKEGNPLEVSGTVRGRVTGLEVREGVVCLMLGELPVPLSTVTSVREPEEG